MADEKPGAWFDESPRLEGRWVGAVAAVVVGLFGVTSVVCVGGLLGAIVLLMRNGFQLAADMTDITGDAMAVSFFGGFGVFLVLGAVLTTSLGWRPMHAFALRTPPIGAVVVALVGGLVVGIFPGWIADQILRAFPDLANSGSLELISSLLMDGTLLERGLTLATIVIGAPILEELCMRGLLWGTLERTLPGQAGQALAFVVTSLAFALVHLDPVQSTALVPTALFFGALRWSSGSIWPSILAHFVNNALAAGMTFAALSMGQDAATPTPLWLGALGLVLTVGLTLALFPLRRRPAATPETLGPVIADRPTGRFDAPGGV